MSIDAASVKLARDRSEGSLSGLRLHGPALLIILLVAAGVRVVLAWPGLNGERELVGDESTYVHLATALARDGTYAIAGVPTATKMPGFSLFIAPFYAWTDRPLAPLGVVVLLSIATCGGLYALGWQLFNRQVGLVAGLLGAVDLNLAVFGSLLLSETLYVLLVLVGVLVVTEAQRRRSGRWLLLGGVFCGLALLTRPHFLPLALVIVGWIWLTWGPDRRRRLTAVALLLAALVMVWSPWPIRNAAVFGELIPLTSQPCPPCTGIYHQGAADPSSPRTFAQWQSIPAPPGFDELGARDQRRGRAIGWILEHPTTAATIALTQVPYLWRPSGLALGSLSPVAWIAYSVLVVVAARGLLRALRERHQSVLLWVAMAVALTMFAVVTIGDPRHRLVLHPVLNVLAARAVVQALRDRRAVAARLPGL